MSKGLPISGNHLQPSDIGEALPYVATERISMTQIAILTANVIHRWKAPADGILEEGWFVLQECGDGGGPSTMDIQKNGVSMLDAAMSIAHTVTNGTEVAAVWDDATVSKGDEITLLPGAGAANSTDASAGYTFRLLGR